MSRHSISADRTCMRFRRTARKWLRSEEHTSELQSRLNLVCRLLLEKKKKHHVMRGPRVSHSDRRGSVGGTWHSPRRWAGVRGARTHTVPSQPLPSDAGGHVVACGVR